MAIKYLYLILSALLLLCLLPMPYGYYSLVRFVSACSFAYIAFRFYTLKKEVMVFVFGALAILFQPFVKLTLGRVIWNIVDIIVAAGLLYMFFKKNSSSR